MSFFFGKLVIVLVVLVACGKVLVWDSLLQFQGQFFQEKPEFLLMRNMPRWTKLLLRQLPFLAPEALLALDISLSPSFHSTQELYDPAIHDRPYRKLITNMLTDSECASLRSLLSRTTLQGNKEIGPSQSLELEFSSKSFRAFLGVEDDEQANATPEEKELLKRLLRRTQKQAEKAFNSTHMILEFSDLTQRRNPIPKSDILKNLHYLTTGGHGLHADQCAVYATDPTSMLESFTCQHLQDHCCAFRTHSILMYLNDLSEMEGGELYLVDRTDLGDENAPSYEGKALGELLQKTLIVKPSCGTMVMFASDARGLHGTLPIKSGTRFAIPMWFANPTDWPWHQQDNVLLQHLEQFWASVHYLCHFMGNEMPVPSGLEQYLGDCDGMVRAVKQLAGVEMEADNEYGDGEDEKEGY